MPALLSMVRLVTKSVPRGAEVPHVRLIRIKAARRVAVTPRTNQPRKEKSLRAAYAQTVVPGGLADRHGCDLQTWDNSEAPVHNAAKSRPCISGMIKHVYPHFHYIAAGNSNKMSKNHYLFVGDLPTNTKPLRNVGIHF